MRYKINFCAGINETKRLVFLTGCLFDRFIQNMPVVPISQIKNYLWRFLKYHR